jgi:23S rRNA (uracil1939-C5)-methyltransferase
VPPGTGPVFEAVVESLDREGRGVAHLDGKAIFITGAITGERVRFTITRDRGTWATAALMSVVRESAARVNPACPAFGVCGGCSIQHVEFRTQVAAKQRILEDAFAHIGQVRPESMLTPIYGPAWGYRHRARLSVRNVPKKGGVLVGFHERGSSYVADMRECHVLPPAISALLVPLRELVGQFSRPDRMPQIEVSIGGDVTVLVFRVLEPFTAEDEAALRAFADAHGVQIWLQTKGPETAVRFHPVDAPALAYHLPEFDVTVGFLPTDFTQVNHEINTVLVRRAIGLLDPRPGESIADLFCGLGNFTLPIARRGARVHGVEGHAGLVARARANAEANGLSPTYAVANLFEPEKVPSLAGFDKLLIDPPREGALEVVKSLPESGGPWRIVYVSCDPATLARDANILVNLKGYRLLAAGVANMFPHTAHVESIALFERR